MSELNDELYLEIEQICMPILQRAARWYARTTDSAENDALQDARLALFRATFEHYDYNRSLGYLRSFAKRTVINCFTEAVAHGRRQKRCPFSPLLYAGAVEFVDPGWTPEQEMMSREFCDVIEARLMARLTEREKQVFTCLVQPSQEFVAYMHSVGASYASMRVIANFLGISKNVADYSKHHIKRHLLQLIESDYKELFEIAERDGKIPMMYYSRCFRDAAYVRHIISAKKLDQDQACRIEKIDRMIDGIHIEREIEWYSWGAIVMLRYGEQAATVIVVGRFNPLTGKVCAGDGYCKQVSDVLAWYPALARALKQKVN